jgi:hypothetical protein
MGRRLMIADAEFSEAAAQPRTASIPLSHLSIELGHLYAEDFQQGPDTVDERFQRIAPWVAAAVRAAEAQGPGGRPRISTCFLVDDYFTDIPGPAEVLDQVRRAAERHGLTIDYLARESACAEADGVPLAEMVVDRLVADPAPHTTGSRPPADESGWLCNGQRTPGPAPAMAGAQPWTPPRENGTNAHSIFVDVELWSQRPGEPRVWSCPFLASVWQLVRLGLLRHHGDPVVRPGRLDDDEVPARWSRMPAVVQLNPKAPPFSAYRTMSVLPSRFLSVELAVRTILGQVSADRAVVEELDRRAANEGMTLPAQLTQRIGYVFVSD